MHAPAGQADPRGSFLLAGQWFVDVVAELPDDAWQGPGLDRWDLRALVGHTTRALLTVRDYLGRADPAAAQPEIDSPAEYFVQAAGLANAAAVAARGVAAGHELGADPWRAVATAYEQAVRAVQAARGDPVIPTVAGTMRLSDYLPTRTLELVVHTGDIVRAAGRPGQPPLEAWLVTGTVLLELTHRRGEDAMLAAALTGRAGLPGGWSALDP